MSTVRQLIDAGAAKHPDRVFLTAAESGQTLTWAQLQQQSRVIDAFLGDKGVAKGETVAFMLNNGYWTCILLLGIMYSQRVMLALNAVSGKKPLSYVIDHSDARLLFINTTYHDQFSSVLNGLASPPKIVMTDEDLGPEVNLPDALLPLADERADELGNESDEVALLMYTSGTTGLPKGVLLTQQNVIAGGQNTATAHQLSADDIGMCVLPLYHINAQMVSVMGALVSGGQIIMASKFSVARFWPDMARFSCTWFSVVPTIISYLIEDQASGVDALTMQAIQGRVRFGRSASAALSPNKHRQFEQCFAIPIVETMGLTETAAQILSNPLPPAAIKYGSPGQAVGNEAQIVSPQGAVLGPHRVGELRIRGANVMQAYYKNPEATSSTLTPDGWLHTGDLAYVDEDGFYFITGRLKELIIKGGENIAPREIDDVLYAHPAVREAAAFGVDDEHYGQEVMACVALCDGMQAEEQELRELCVAELGAYKAPKRVMIREQLPKGPSGKIQRLKLRV